MAKDLKKGDRVEWDSHGGKAVGKVEKKITSEYGGGRPQGQGFRGRAAVQGALGEVGRLRGAQAGRSEEDEVGELLTSVRPPRRG